MSCFVAFVFIGRFGRAIAGASGQRSGRIATVGARSPACLPTTSLPSDHSANSLNENENGSRTCVLLVPGWGSHGFGRRVCFGDLFVYLVLLVIYAGGPPVQFLGGNRFETMVIQSTRGKNREAVLLVFRSTWTARALEFVSRE